MHALRNSLLLAMFALFVASVALAQPYEIIRAEYGAGKNWADVTQQLCRMASTDATFRMGNSTFGIDPAPGVVWSTAAAWASRMHQRR